MVRLDNYIEKIKIILRKDGFNIIRKEKKKWLEEEFESKVLEEIRKEMMEGRRRGT